MRPPRRSALVVAWTGAVLFAASLVWFVYCYLVRFGRPAPPGDVLSPVLVNVLLFSAFALHHSVLARSRAKQTVRQIVPAELERSLYTWVASLLFLAVCTWWQPVPGVLYQVDGPWRMGAWAVQLLGILLTLRASNALDVLDLAGVRAVQRSLAGVRAVQRSLAGVRTVLRSGATTADHPPLTTRGLYGFVRHPLYFAWALFVFATPTMTGTRAAFAIISTAYLMIAIPWEERGLVETFGQEYEVYRRSVKTRMIPWVY
jgi:protein-S-isoprenylcysteine O-methyltransferase Ste14